jgi:prolyl-tRNA synthetase
LQASLQALGVRVFLDDRDSQTPGWKFAEWELRGVPLRMEIGPKDLEKSAVMVARRDTRTKESMPMDGLAPAVVAKLDEIQAALLQRARAFREDHTTRVASYDEFKAAMEGAARVRDRRLVRRCGLRGPDQGRHAGDAEEHPLWRC